MKRTRSRRARSGAVVGRTLSLLAFLPLASRAPVYARLVLALIQDPRVPAGRKALLAGAGAYVVWGGDLIPDAIPIVGGIDDVIVVMLAVDLFLDGVPDLLLAEKLDELGIERSAFDRDVAQLRRVMPRPVRRALRDVPRVLDTIIEISAQAGRGVRLLVRGPKEDPLA